jgi:hypothetical protein
LSAEIHPEEGIVMKFLVGIISGIALTGAGVAVVSNQTSSASAGAVTPQVAFTQQAVAAQQGIAAAPAQKVVQRRVQGFAGELSRSDAGALELRTAVRRSGVLVDRDLRILVAHARVTTAAGRLVRLPRDTATVRVFGGVLPRSAWRLDDDGQLIPTVAATRIVVVAKPVEQDDEAQTQDRESEHVSSDAQDTNSN